MFTDVPALFDEIGVPLPAGGDNRSVQCFANPGAHRADDRNPSCSVNVHTGAWICHACGACGGAYAAALARGLDEAAAKALCDRHGIERHGSGRRHPAPWSRTAPQPRRMTDAAPLPSEQQVAAWAECLASSPALLARAEERKGWTPGALVALEIGWDQRAKRFTIPIRDAAGELVNVVRYLPGGTPKSRAIKGRPRDLFPAPERIRHDARELFAAGHAPTVLLVEGEPDAIAAQSLVPAQYAVGLPGARWDAAWTPRFAGLNVAILTDHDDPGRRISAAAEGALVAAGVPTRRLTWPTVTGRQELPAGYDLSDWLVDHHQTAIAA